MIRISTKKLEKALGKKVIPFITVLGIDTATRTGWCRATSDPENVDFDYGVIDIATTDKYFKYNRYIEIFANMPATTRTIIEETYYGRNVKVFQTLSRLGAFIYAVLQLKGVKDKQFMLTSHARKMLGFKGNQKKAVFHKEFVKKLDIDLTDEDIIDAMVLAIAGLIE